MRIADSLRQLETVLWFGGSFGEFTATDEAIIASLLDRSVDCFVVADDPFVLRNDEADALPFFARFGMQFQGVDVPTDSDNGRRVLSGIDGDPVTGSLGLLDCQLPRLDHHRGGRFVPNVRFRVANTRASECLINKDNNAPIGIRMEVGERRTLVVGMNPARMLDESRGTQVLD